MENIALHQRGAERRKARLRIKLDRVILRVERHAREAALACVCHERIEYQPPDAASAVRSEHRHASHLGRIPIDAIISTCPDGRARIEEDGVARIGIGTIVLVDFFFGRHPLFVDENAKAHQKCRLHPFAVCNIKEFDAHALASDSACGVEVRVVFQRIHLCTGLLERDGRILLVANAYPNHTRLLWNLPGGRQDGRETCAMTVVRELREECSLDVRVRELAYVAESFDVSTNTQFTAFCFRIDAEGEPVVPPADAHVREARWLPRSELAAILHVGVVRDPLLAHLADPAQQYFGYMDAGITIAFGDEPASPPAANPRA